MQKNIKSTGSVLTNPEQPRGLGSLRPELQIPPSPGAAGHCPAAEVGHTKAVLED